MHANDTAPQPILDTNATMALERLRASLDGALVQFNHDPLLRRALIQAAGAIDTRLGRPKDLPPNRRDRRGGPR